VEAISDLNEVLSELIKATKAGELDAAIAQALKPKPKYKPGAARSADIHRLKRS
jgi:hypothetical protein